jgi:hypothetical protein
MMLADKQEKRAVIKGEALDAYLLLMQATGISHISDAISYMSKYIPDVIQINGLSKSENRNNYFLQTIDKPEIIKIDSSVAVEF